jgi:hypothetical protein
LSSRYLDCGNLDHLPRQAPDKQQRNSKRISAFAVFVQDGDGQPKSGPVFPSEIWENGRHFNFLAGGYRFETNDTRFLNWTRTNGSSVSGGSGGSGGESGLFMREGSHGTVRTPPCVLRYSMPFSNQNG